MMIISELFKIRPKTVTKISHRAKKYSILTKIRLFLQFSAKKRVFI